MDSIWIGYALLIVNFFVIVGVFIYKHYMWNVTRPKFNVGALNVRCRDPKLASWDGLERVGVAMRNVLVNEYGSKLGTAFVDSFISHLIIEIVGANDQRVTPTTVVSEQSRIAGSIDIERKWPWSDKHYVAVVLRRAVYDTADKAAIIHECIKHNLPLYMGDGDNRDHSRKDLDNLELRINKEIAVMKRSNHN